jgi:predicted site-specific integrase-resolvase
MGQEQERMLTTREFADLLGISTATAKRWSRRYPHQLGAVKVVRTWKFPQSKAQAVRVHGLSDQGELVDR